MAVWGSSSVLHIEAEDYAEHRAAMHQHHYSERKNGAVSLSIEGFTEEKKRKQNNLLIY